MIGRTPLLACALAFAGLSAAAAGQPLPDLVALVPDDPSEQPFLDLDTTVEIGDVAELCASATNGVDLLRFGTVTRNLGTADLDLGDPMCPEPCSDHPDADCGNPDFHCSPAGGHNHPHFTDYAHYELFQNGALIRAGGKFGFCLEDTSCDVGSDFQFDCENQGLTVGCEDLYDAGLGCQYIDVTGLPSGDYVLRVTADPLNKIPELDETNNASEYPVTIAGTEETEVELPGTSLEMKTTREGTLVKFEAHAKDDFGLPSDPFAPTIDGATLLVADLGNDAQQTFDLPADGWKGLGHPAGKAGYRFESKTGACRKAKLKANHLSATCLATDVALPAAGEVVIEFVSSAMKTYCATFGGTEKKNDAEKLKRVKAPPFPCPAG